jgi:citrate/tricarballylate utilization protein
MGSLEELTRQARALADGGAHLSAEDDAARQLQICNACRYCEGFCAMFPAMTRRLEFAVADTHFLANLCHNCGACLHACQYAPPHEFAVNIPRAMAKVRQQSYVRYAWPGALAGVYQRNGVGLVLLLTLLLAMGLRALMQPAAAGAGFYAWLPHNTLVAVFAPVFVLSLWAIIVAVRRYGQDMRRVTTGVASQLKSVGQATHNAMTLRYLDGGHGDGCNNTDDAFSHARRHAHHLTFYGFALCFASTSVATLFHYLWGWSAPYDLPSLPKWLGLVGGVMLCLGTAAQCVLKMQRHPMHGDPAQHSADYGLMVLLFVIASSGLGLWWARGHQAMPWALALHLGAVMALFVTAPYGKMVHGFFRWMALNRHAVEQSQPSNLGLGSD